MPSNWVSSKFEWLDAVASDPTLPRLALAVAIKLVGYFNSQTHEAWPSVQTLAEELGSDRRSIQRALNKLVEAGKLRVERGGRSGNDTNRYRMDDSFAGQVRAVLKGKKGGANAAPKGGTDAARRAQRGGVHVPKGAASTSQKGRRGRRPNPGREPGKEPGSAASRLARPLPLLLFLPFTRRAMDPGKAPADKAPAAKAPPISPAKRQHGPATAQHVSARPRHGAAAARR